MATPTESSVSRVDMTRPISGTPVMRAYAIREVVPRIRYARLVDRYGLRFAWMSDPELARCEAIVAEAFAA